ncbi:MAG: hypothetical protein C5B55_10665 [Blastocatellia bacterium]|nr:MAG: hypothetical protein C5B55_10665 [Blastocatellia bacterium]
MNQGCCAIKQDSSHAKLLLFPPAQASVVNAMASARVGVSQAYAMFGSATEGLEGNKEKLSNYARERSVADNIAQSRRQIVEANTDSQAGRKQEWSRRIGAVPIVGPPSIKHYS